MIPFPFNENQFSLFVADHLLVGQLCTNPKSDRSLLLCLKVTQCSMSEIGDALLYNSCSLPIQVMTTGTLPALTKCKWMVQRLRAQLNALDDPLEVVEWKPKAEDTTRKTWTKEFIEKVQAIIDETPQRPIRQIARDLGISHTTVNVYVKEDMKCRSYRCQTSQILTEKTKNLRLIKSIRLLNKLKHPKKPNMLWFFSDEKNFCQDQVQNSQNHRWIATNNRDVPKVMKTKFPATVMVFGVVSSESHIMPPHIFKVSLKVNTKVYLDVLKSVVIPWCN